MKSQGGYAKLDDDGAVVKPPAPPVGAPRAPGGPGLFARLTGSKRALLLVLALQCVGLIAVAVSLGITARHTAQMSGSVVESFGVSDEGCPFTVGQPVSFARDGLVRRGGGTTVYRDVDNVYFSETIASHSIAALGTNLLVAGFTTDGGTSYIMLAQQLTSGAGSPRVSFQWVDMQTLAPTAANEVAALSNGSFVVAGGGYVTLGWIRPMPDGSSYRMQLAPAVLYDFATAARHGNDVAAAAAGPSATGYGVATGGRSINATAAAASGMATAAESAGQPVASHAAATAASSSGLRTLGQAAAGVLAAAAEAAAHDVMASGGGGDSGAFQRRLTAAAATGGAASNSGAHSSGRGASSVSSLSAAALAAGAGIIPPQYDRCSLTVLSPSTIAISYYYVEGSGAASGTLGAGNVSLVTRVGTVIGAKSGGPVPPAPSPVPVMASVAGQRRTKIADGAQPAGMATAGGGATVLAGIVAEGVPPAPPQPTPAAAADTTSSSSGSGSTASPAMAGATPPGATVVTWPTVTWGAPTTYAQMHLAHAIAAFDSSTYLLAFPMDDGIASGSSSTGYPMSVRAAAVTVVRSGSSQPSSSSTGTASARTGPASMAVTLGDAAVLTGVKAHYSFDLATVSSTLAACAFMDASVNDGVRIVLVHLGAGLDIYFGSALVVNNGGSFSGGTTAVNSALLTLAVQPLTQAMPWIVDPVSPLDGLGGAEAFVASPAADAVVASAASAVTDDHKQPRELRLAATGTGGAPRAMSPLETSDTAAKQAPAASRGKSVTQRAAVRLRPSLHVGMGQGNDDAYADDDDGFFDDDASGGHTVVGADHGGQAFLLLYSDTSNGGRITATLAQVTPNDDVVLTSPAFVVGPPPAAALTQTTASGSRPAGNPTGFYWISATTLSHTQVVLLDTADTATAAAVLSGTLAAPARDPLPEDGDEDELLDDADEEEGADDVAGASLDDRHRVHVNGTNGTMANGNDSALVPANSTTRKPSSGAQHRRVAVARALSDIASSGGGGDAGSGTGPRLADRQWQQRQQRRMVRAASRSRLVCTDALGSTLHAPLDSQDPYVQAGASLDGAGLAGDMAPLLPPATNAQEVVRRRRAQQAAESREAHRLPWSSYRHIDGVQACAGWQLAEEASITPLGAGDAGVPDDGGIDAAAPGPRLGPMLSPHQRLTWPGYAVTVANLTLVEALNAPIGIALGDGFCDSGGAQVNVIMQGVYRYSGGIPQSGGALTLGGLRKKKAASAPERVAGNAAVNATQQQPPHGSKQTRQQPATGIDLTAVSRAFASWFSMTTGTGSATASAGPFTTGKAYYADSRGRLIEGSYSGAGGTSGRPGLGQGGYVTTTTTPRDPHGGTASVGYEAYVGVALSPTELLVRPGAG